VEVIRLAALRTGPLSVDELRAAVSDPGAGGIALFAGAVRDRDRGRAVTRLSYSAHPSAAVELRRVAEKIAADYDVRALAAVHRIGDLEIGDLAVVVAASCAHRAEAAVVRRRGQRMGRQCLSRLPPPAARSPCWSRPPGSRPP
jgi:molybdopterin synthase catalytic subunit